MGIKVMTTAERIARNKPYNDINRAFRMGFSRQDLPRDKFGNLKQGYAAPGMRQNRFAIQKSADFLLGRGGDAIRAREKAKFDNIRKQLAADRLNDPQRTKTYTVRQGGEGGTTQTFRDPIEYQTAGQEILSNLSAAQRGTGMSDSSKLGGMSAQDAMLDYGKRSVLIGEANQNPAPRSLGSGVMMYGSAPQTTISLDPSAAEDFSRKII
jgi:hypothetical protein